ncbi:MAG: polymer-forming cytoskeletal protein [Defluviitaleaceae bacterium]|nr:polymer-forming cytoskeletal protein [Defluviitaleaceae bacterium]
MFSKSRDTVLNETNITTQTVIAEGITIKGNVICGSGSVSVGGVFFGEIDIDGFLIITESGNVRGSVRAANVHIYGTLEGDVSAIATVRIFNGGKICGDVSCASFVVDEGAAFGGRCNMGEDEHNPPQRLSRYDRQDRYEPIDPEPLSVSVAN